jgi:hypothetical protein
MQHRGLHRSRSLAALMCAIAFVAVPLKAFADRESDVAALEAQCEAQREQLIKPLREKEIEKCKADRHNDPDYCERFWKDYGNEVRGPHGVMIPRMFGDIPVCEAAFKARKALANDAR